MMTAYPVPTFDPEIYVRDTRGNLNGPYDTAAEAVCDHINELPEAVQNAIDSHLQRGYRITHWYNDGAIRVEETPETIDKIPGATLDNLLFVFIRTDGTVTKPKSWAAVRAVLDATDYGKRPC